MLKMTTSIDGVVMFEQVEIDSVVAEWFPDPCRVLDTIDRQGWYSLVNYNEDEGVTICYRVAPTKSLATSHLVV